MPCFFPPAGFRPPGVCYLAQVPTPPSIIKQTIPMIKFLYKSMFAATLMASQTVFGSPMTAPQVFHAGEENYPTVDQRRIQMASSLVVAENGRIWITWYAGPSPNEDDNNYLVLASSGDDGSTWQEVLVVDPDGTGPVRAYDPEIWIDPQGRMWLFWAQAVKHGVDAITWAMVTENPEDAKPVWGAPRQIAPGVMMCKPTVLSNGEWLFPISDWEIRMSKEEGASAGARISKDQGATFALRGAALVPRKNRTFDEHMIVQRKDESLWMLVRTNYGIGESISRDLAKTWSEVEPTDIPHPSARFFIRRLASGNLLLVKHGAMEGKSGRSRLTAFVSEDDGKTWVGGLLLDERNGVSYPDGQEAADGTIYITYDYNRTQERAIHMTTFTEADALAGKDVSGKVRLRISVTTPGLLLDEPTAPYETGSFKLADNQSGAEPATGLTSLESLDDREVDTLKIGARIWSNRTYVFSVLPEAVQGKRFIRTEIGERGIRGKAERDGVVYVLSRRDVGDEGLAKAGFEKTNIPEFIPFAPGDKYRENNAFSVFQKSVKKGDIVTGGAFGLLVFAAE
jgi:predicted neuraminidase